jgi:hypothetical protein
VPTDRGCKAAIGDAPGTGLKSAFVGRFIGHLFRSRANTKYPAGLLEDINFSLSTFDHFERISMQCVHLDLAEGVFTISNAGHSALAHFSRRRGKCDPLWVPGELLHDSTRQTHRLSYYENYMRIFTFFHPGVFTIIHPPLGFAFRFLAVSFLRGNRQRLLV